MCNLGRGHYEDHFCEIILNLDQRLRCPLKIFLSLALFCSATVSGLDHLGRGHYEEHSCEIIGQCNLEIFFVVVSTGSYFVEGSGSVCVILVERIMGNINVRLFFIWTNGSEDAF